MKQNQCLTPTLTSHFTKNKYLSYASMIISCVAWVTAYLYSNDNNFDPLQTSIIRGLMIMLISALLCKWEGVQLNLRNSVKLVMQRNIVFIFQGFLMAILQFYLPLSVIHTLTVTSTIFVSIWQYIFQKKVPSLNQYIAITVTLVGIVLTANGNIFLKWIDPTYQFSSGFANYRTNDPKIISFCSLILVLFMIIWSYSVYSTSKMHVSPFLINFLLGAKIYFISSILYPFINYQSSNSQIYTPHVDATVFYLGFLFSGVLFAIAQTTFVISLVMAENIGMTTMMISTTILAAYFVSVLKYHEEINIFCLVGSIFIVTGLGKIMLHS